MGPTQVWESSFSTAARRTGRHLFEEGRAEVSDHASDFAVVQVRGERAFEVVLELEEGEVRAGCCSCPAGAGLAGCEHRWAALLAARDYGLVAGAAAGEPGAPPLAVSEPEEREPAWRRALGELFEELDAAPNDPWQAVEPARRELLYVVDFEASGGGGGIALDVLARRRLRSGEWGKPRAFDPAATPDEDCDGLDRRALEVLRPIAREGGRVMLGRAEREALLPELASAGRLALRRRAEAEPLPLEWDGGEPWRPGLRLARDARKLECALVPYVARAERRLELRPGLRGGPLVLHGLLFHGGRVGRVRDEGVGRWVRALQARGALRAPLEHERELARSLLALPGAFELDLPPELLEEAPAPVPELEVRGGRGEERELCDCHIAFDYGGTRVPLAARGRALEREGTMRLVRRNTAAEAEALRRFLELGGRRDREGLLARDASVPRAQLGALVRGLLREGWSVRVDGALCRNAGELRCALHAELDWLELRGSLDFGGGAAPLPALLLAQREGRFALPLADGSLGVLPDEWPEEWEALAALGELRGGKLRFRRPQALVLQALLAVRGEVALEGELEGIAERLAQWERIPPRREPARFRGELRPYQRAALGWFHFLRELGAGGCLADDMGLGKTVQVLALLAERKAVRGRAAASLVVAPRSLTFNWVREAQRFVPGLELLDFTGPARHDRRIDPAEHDLVVTTYGTLRSDVLAFEGLRFDYVILDEAQAIKNPASQTARAVRVLEADHRLALSGTPIENHLGELWSLFEFLNPGMLGRAAGFERLVKQELRGEATRQGRERVGRALRPFLLRRTKRAVLRELPPKTEQVLWCDLDEETRAEYEELAAHYRRELLRKLDEGDEQSARMHVLEGLLRLRQLACHPGLLDPARRHQSCAKLDLLLPQLAELAEAGHKALVFSQFTSFLSLLRAALDQRGLATENLDGSTRDRAARVENFQSPDGPPIFLISLKAGGTGLNLTAADYVYLLDPWWNPAAESQAIDRAHRMGQTRPVVAYRLIARGTVEERVLELQAEKRALADALVQADDSFLRRMRREDVERLLA